MARPKEFGEILKDAEKLDRAHDKQVSQRKNFDKVHNAAQNKAIRDAGIKREEHNRGISRRQDSRFDDKKIKR